MADDYQMLEELGRGNFGVVYKALERSTGDLVAVKLVSATVPTIFHLLLLSFFFRYSMRTYNRP